MKRTSQKLGLAGLVALAGCGQPKEPIRADYDSYNRTTINGVVLEDKDKNGDVDGYRSLPLIYWWIIND